MNREEIRRRANHRCEYCGDPESLSLATFHIENIVARQHGGGDDGTNLALACPDCNLLKGPNLASLDTSTGEMTRLFHPRTDLWAEHFAFAGVVIEGRTAVGRATARLFDFNSAARVRHRTLVRELGV